LRSSLHVGARDEQVRPVLVAAREGDDCVAAPTSFDGRRLLAGTGARDEADDQKWNRDRPAGDDAIR
jgi:hypothetical protein